MIVRDLATVDCQPKSSRTDIEKSSGIGEVGPVFLLVRLIARDALMAA
jgi:hypothetical protein